MKKIVILELTVVTDEREKGKTTTDAYLSTLKDRTKREDSRF